MPKLCIRNSTSQKKILLLNHQKHATNKKIQRHALHKVRDCSSFRKFLSRCNREGRPIFLYLLMTPQSEKHLQSLSVLQSLTEELGDLEMQWSVTDISLDISISIFPSASTFQFCCNHLHSSCPHQMITTSFCEIALGSLLPDNLNCAKTYNPDLV